MSVTDFQRHEHTVRMTMRMLEDSYMTAAELDELSVIAKSLHDLEQRVRTARVLEQHADFPLKHPGRPFATLAPSGRMTYFETREEVIEYAEKRSKALAKGGDAPKMLTMSWAPHGTAQDSTNQGWSMFGSAEAGVYAGPREESK